MDELLAKVAQRTTAREFGEGMMFSDGETESRPN